MAVERQVGLRLAAADGGAVAVSDMSAVHCDGDVLWVAADEGVPELYRLTAAGDGYGDPRAFALGEFVAVLTMIALAGIIGAALSRGISETA